MKIVSVNVSRLQEVVRNGKTWRTGIFKTPVPSAAGPVMVRRLGLDGDEQGDRKHHGGEHMAVYAYTRENYDHWRAEIPQHGFPLGCLGENLTVEGLGGESDIHIGDVFRVGSSVRLQVSSPRAPCSTLAMAMGMPEFPKAFLKSGRVGFYMRVLEEGPVAPGDSIERLSTDPARLSVREVTELMFFDTENIAGAARAAAVEALKPEWREKLHARLLSKK